MDPLPRGLRDEGASRRGAPGTTSRPETAVVRARAVTKRLGARLVLRGVDLEACPGEWVSLVGPNGAGKTTLLRLLALLMVPDTGAIRWFDGRLDMPEIRRRIGFVGHDTYLYEHLTARENLAYYAALLRVPNRRAQVDVLLERVGLARVADTLVRTFSRGMRQRLTLARALLGEPRLLLLDEPRTGLDRGGRAVLDALVDEARAAGAAVVASDHDVVEAVSRADRVVVLDRGRPLLTTRGGNGQVEAVLAALANARGLTDRPEGGAYR